MPVLIVGTEKTLAALRPRLFTGRISTRKAREVVDAIRAANPDVDLERLTPGTVLTVPEGIGARMRHELSLDEGVTEAIDLLASQARTALEELVTSARSREREQAAEHRSLAKALRSKELQSAIRREPSLKNDIDSARKAVDDAEVEAKERAAKLGHARDGWLAEIDALSTQLKR